MINLQIGGATKKSKFAAKAVDIDWDALPEASKAFAIAYGLKQYIADGAAGANDQKDFDDGIAARVGNLLSGDFSRKAGEGFGKIVDDPKVLAKRLAGDEVRAAIEAKQKADAAYVKPDAEKRKAIVEAYFAKNEARLVKLATAQIEARKTASAEIDIDSFLA